MIITKLSNQYQHIFIQIGDESRGIITINQTLKFGKIYCIGPFQQQQQLTTTQNTNPAIQEIFEKTCSEIYRPCNYLLTRSCPQRNADRQCAS